MLRCCENVYTNKQRKDSKVKMLHILSANAIACSGQIGEWKCIYRMLLTQQDHKSDKKKRCIHCLRCFNLLHWNFAMQRHVRKVKFPYVDFVNFARFRFDIWRKDLNKCKWFIVRACKRSQDIASVNWLCWADPYWFVMEWWRKIKYHIVILL